MVRGCQREIGHLDLDSWRVPKLAGAIDKAKARIEALEAASEADRLFTVLMGEEVEGRRTYIEDHALDVKNLDV